MFFAVHQLSSSREGTIGTISDLEEKTLYLVVKKYDEQMGILAVTEAKESSSAEKSSYPFYDLLVILFGGFKAKGLEEGDHFLIVENEKGEKVIHLLGNQSQD